MGNINRTNFELIVELRKKKNILLRMICCQKKKIIRIYERNFFFIYMKANFDKKLFSVRQRGHWRGIDSRKLPSAENFLGKRKKEKFFLYNCFFSGRVI